MEEHHRFLLGLRLRRLEAAEEDLAASEQRIAEKLKPYAKQLDLLQEIPGVDWILAAVIIAELGVDMSIRGPGFRRQAGDGVHHRNKSSNHPAVYPRALRKHVRDL